MQTKFGLSEELLLVLRKYSLEIKGTYKTKKVGGIGLFVGGRTN